MEEKSKGGIKFIKWDPNHVGKKWTISAAIDEEGMVSKLLSGYYGVGLENNIHYKESDDYKEVPNFIFSASIAPISMSRGRSSVITKFSVKDTDIILEFGPKTVLTLIEAVIAGQIVVVDGYLTGLFTFLKQGSSVYTTPWYD